jgi:hypothetical protein
MDEKLPINGIVGEKMLAFVAEKMKALEKFARLGGGSGQRTHSPAVFASRFWFSPVPRRSDAEAGPR